MYVKRVIAGVSGSAGSLQALRYATEMAIHHDAALVPVLAWIPPGGDLADRRFPSPELREAWLRAAWEQLWGAVDLGIGGPPDGLGFTPQAVRGEPGQVLTQAAALPGMSLSSGPAVTVPFAGCWPPRSAGIASAMPSVPLSPCRRPRSRPRLMACAAGSRDTGSSRPATA